jgi:hypothetical protein
VFFRVPDDLLPGRAQAHRALRPQFAPVLLAEQVREPIVGVVLHRLEEADGVFGFGSLARVFRDATRLRFRSIMSILPANDRATRVPRCHGPGTTLPAAITVKMVPSGDQSLGLSHTAAENSGGGRLTATRQRAVSRAEPKKACRNRDDMGLAVSRHAACGAWIEGSAGWFIH